jgi:hypothetical protein
MPGTGFRLEASSQVKADTLAQWIGSPLTENIKQVPGIGDAGVEALAKEGITTPYQLLGKYLMLRDKGMTTQEHCDAFYAWLKDIGISSYRAGVVRAMAEKANSMMPGLFNEAELE